MTEKLCVRCHAAPVNIGPKKPESYCKPCRNESQRTRAARYRQKTGPRTCPRCKAVHTDGGSDAYCKTCRRAYHRERRDDPAVRDGINARQRARYLANLEHEKELRRGYRDKAKREAINAYGGKCACCGETHIEFLAIDHINGGGIEHRKQASAVGSRFYRWLARQGFPQGELRVLCHNCNQSLGYYGYCPHDPEFPSRFSPFLSSSSIT